MKSKNFVIVYSNDEALCAIQKAKIKATRNEFKVIGTVFFDADGDSRLYWAFKNKSDFSVKSGRGHRRKKLRLSFLVVGTDSKCEMQFEKA